MERKNVSGLPQDTFEEIRIKYFNAWSHYDDALGDPDESEIEAAKAEMQEAHQAIRNIGEIDSRAGWLLRLYCQSMERGNLQLDISEPISHGSANVGWLLALMKEQGISVFTLSSTWTSTVEDAWKFQEAGCTLEGMVQVYSSEFNGWPNGGYKKVPAFLFRINN